MAGYNGTCRLFISKSSALVCNVDFIWTIFAIIKYRMDRRKYQTYKPVNRVYYIIILVGTFSRTHLEENKPIAIWYIDLQCI